MASNSLNYHVVNNFYNYQQENDYYFNQGYQSAYPNNSFPSVTGDATYRNSPEYDTVYPISKQVVPHQNKPYESPTPPAEYPSPYKNNKIEESFPNHPGYYQEQSPEYHTAYASITPPQLTPSTTPPQFTIKEEPELPAWLNGGKVQSKRSRQTYTRFQSLELEKEYLMSHYISKDRRQKLAQITGLHEKQIKVWFQNRRMKDKKLVRDMVDHVLDEPKKSVV